jgi:hypothetical protein
MPEARAASPPPPSHVGAPQLPGVAAAYAAFRRSTARRGRRWAVVFKTTCKNVIFRETTSPAGQFSEIAGGDITGAATAVYERQRTCHQWT